MYDLLQYWGLDWLSVALGLLGTYLIGEKNRVGFMLIICSLCCAAVVAVLAETYAFLFSNIPAILINFNAFLKWKRDEDCLLTKNEKLS